MFKYNVRKLCVEIILAGSSAFRRNAIFITFIDNYRYQSARLLDSPILISTQILLLKEQNLYFDNLKV